MDAGAVVVYAAATGQTALQWGLPGLQHSAHVR